MIAFTLAAFANPLVDALVEELDRAPELSIPEAPPLYHTRYHLVQADQYELTAAFGSVLEEDDRPFNQLGVELRVGSPAYDNTGFGGWEDGFLRAQLAMEPTPLDTRQVAWRATDRAYKQAIEQHARKSAQFEAPPDYPGDYWMPEARTVDDGERPDLDVPTIRELGLALSERFTPIGDALLSAEVHVGMEAGDVWLVDDLGSRIHKPLAEVTLRATAALRTDDGELLTDDRLWSVQTTDQLPSREAMLAEVDALRDALVERAQAVPLAEEYVGPVVFEGEAALALFRYLLVPQLEGTPAEIPFDSFFGDLGEQKASVRVGRRVLPEGWSVVDDPRANPSHPASFEHDWDGTPTQAVGLVADGIVRDLLMSRVPRKGRTPNGHGRTFLGTRASGRAAIMDVDPGKVRATKKLHRRALKMAAAYGHDHVMVIRRLQEHSVRNLHARTSFFGGDAPPLPPPVELVRLYTDGREEVVRGATFAGIQRYVLRDIAMAGPLRSGTFLASLDGDPTYLSPTEGMPTALTAPDVLVREIELVPGSRDPRDKPVLQPVKP